MPIPQASMRAEAAFHSLFRILIFHPRFGEALVARAHTRQLSDDEAQVLPVALQIPILHVVGFEFLLVLIFAGIANVFELRMQKLLMMHQRCNNTERA